MRTNHIRWLLPIFLIALVPGVWSTAALAAEEIKAPLLTGLTWVQMSQDQKSAYIWGAGDVIDLEAAKKIKTRSDIGRPGGVALILQILNILIIEVFCKSIY